MKLNIDMLQHLYEYFAASEPFRRWNLPPAEDVVFKVARTSTLYGWHQTAFVGRGKNRKLFHYVTISAGKQAHTYTIATTMAHEMIHMVTDRTCKGLKAEHGPVFRKLARLVAKHHGFDPLAL